MTDSGSSSLQASPQKRNSHGSDPPLPQDALQTVLIEELRWATFETPALQFGVAQGGMLQDLTKSMLHLFNDTPLKNGFVSKDASIDPPLPIKRQKMNERSHYTGIVALLNKTVDAFRSIASATPSYHLSGNLTFSKYDARMGLVDGAAPIQPDIMGIHGGSTYTKHREERETAEITLAGNADELKKLPKTSGARKTELKSLIRKLRAVLRKTVALEWSDSEISVEVKSTWSQMMIQATTYGRAMLLTRKNRLWAPVICVNHVECSIRFVFFHRGGILSSTVCELKTMDGFKSYLHMMSFILSRANKFEAGMDPSRTDTFFRLPYLGLWEWERDFCYRASLCGRCTEVVRLKKTIHDAILHASSETSLSTSLPSQSVDTTTDAKAEHNRFLFVMRSIRRKQTGILPCDPSLIWVEDEARNKLIKFRDLLNENSSLVFKDSWPHQARANNEARMFTAGQWMFGIPDVVYSYEVRNDVKGDHSIFFQFFSTSSPDCRYFAAYGGKLSEEQKVLKPEIRSHMRSIFSSEGEHLDHARGPKELTIAIVHALIGYYNLFEAGWVQRDISDGNVLMFQTPVKFVGGRRVDAPSHAAVGKTFGQEECTAFITDGDQAVEWAETRSSVNNGSGTIPFMSIRLLAHWSRIPTTSGPHTPIDDLESFTWLLVWFLLGAGAARGRLSPTEMGHWVEMSSEGDPRILLGIKALFIRFVERFDADDPYDKQSFLLPYIPLLQKWLTIGGKTEKPLRALAHGKSDEFYDLATVICESALREAIVEGLAAATFMSDVWPEPATDD